MPCDVGERSNDVGDAAMRAGSEDDATGRGDVERSRADGRADQDRSRRRGAEPVEAASTRRDRAAGRSGAVVHLSPHEVEQVIARAVELQQHREVGAAGALTLEDLQSVAAQVGVAPELVQRALDDVRMRATTPTDEHLLDRILGPRRVASAAVVDSNPDETSRAVVQWMTTDEGLQRTGSRDGADTWAKDNRLLAQVKHGLKATRGDGVLRGLPGVTSTVEHATDGTFIAVEADTTSIRTANAAVLSVGTVAGLVAGALASANLPETYPIASDPGQFTTFFAIPFVPSVGAWALIRHRWVGRVRRAVGKAIDGISLTAQDRDGAEAPADDWRSLTKRWIGGV